MFKREIFRKHVYSIEESTYNIVGTFPRPGNCAPLVTPLISRTNPQTLNQSSGLAILTGVSCRWLVCRVAQTCCWLVGLSCCADELRKHEWKGRLPGYNFLEMMKKDGTYPTPASAPGGSRDEQEEPPKSWVAFRTFFGCCGNSIDVTAPLFAALCLPSLGNVQEGQTQRRRQKLRTTFIVCVFLRQRVFNTYAIRW